jgi:hypothetical protein
MGCVDTTLAKVSAPSESWSFAGEVDVVVDNGTD